ncbi:hypothetical protein ACFPER_14915 [Agromyces aurantiacus]|uniref:Major facilitator superfamily (MFS) profile domain-containing protein n=1 Tax=Agromyces aurantiacus TaxID=165814 RepID=A0ABV9R8H4_9MICO|nr:hypothetical protein [Agromyces aurantiacus]MBM7505012.1 hypothetical protein [Agromyces aurantiacus]
MSTSSDRPGREPYPAGTPAERPVPTDTVHDDRTIVRDDGTVERERVAERRVDTDGDGIADERVVREDRAVRDERPIADPAVRAAVVDRERERYGGIKFGAAFFGWLTAVGVGVLLTALLAATGAALGIGTLGEAVDEAAAQNAQTIGIVGAIALLVILFVAYFAGGYVAGRMARFNGMKQGIAVWLWAIVIAVVGAVIAAGAGAQYDVLASLNTFPRIPVTEGELTVAGIVTLVIVLLASLGGAILGGKTGTRYHRKVDAAGFGA